MCIVQLPIGFLLSINNWSWPVGVQWFWLVVIGLAALSAHYSLAKAMQYAEVTTVVTIDFIRLPLIALVGIFLYAEQFEASLILGGVLMLVGNLVNINQSRESARNKVINFAPTEPDEAKPHRL